MIVRLEEPEIVPQVAAYFRGFDCEVSITSDGVLDVAFAPPLVVSEDPAWLERIRLEAYVRTWNALHPTARAVIGDSA